MFGGAFRTLQLLDGIGDGPVCLETTFTGFDDDTAGPGPIPAILPRVPFLSSLSSVLKISSSGIHRGPHRIGTGSRKGGFA